MTDLAWYIFWRDESPDTQPWSDITSDSSPARIREWKVMLSVWIDRFNITDFNGSLLRIELDGRFDATARSLTRRFLQEHTNEYPRMKEEYTRPGPLRVTEYMYNFMRGLLYDTEKGIPWLPTT